MGKKKSGGGKSKADKELSKAQRIEAKKAKQQAKGLKKERKQQEEEDIELILQEFLKKDAEKTQITIESCPQPTPRANFSMSLLPSGNEMALFGGEYFDGEVNSCFNDLFKWNLDTNEWKSISSPNSPPPRCSHQSAVYRDHLYVFGGEFATADQFHHYRDFWRLDLKTNAWEALDERGGPSPRSGHRMVVWRNYLIVFGGFYEAARETKWFNDLFIYNFAEMKWRKVTYPLLKQVPAPRSGCQLAVHPSKDILFLYGGYAKVKNVGEKSEGKVYSDLWALQLAPILKRQDPVWEKLSKKGQAPSPRGGAAVTVHKNRLILFGGVFDEEGRRHTLQSTFYNDLFVYDMDRRRWFEFRLRGKKSAAGGKRRRKKKVGGTDGDDVNGDNDDGDEDDEEEDDFEKMLENQFGYVDEDGNIVYIENEEEEEHKVQEKPDEASRRVLALEEEEESKEEEPVATTSKPLATDEITVQVDSTKDEAQEQVKEARALKPIKAPSPRINPALLIRNSTLYVYGGVVEDGDREITLDDCWSLDLKKLEEWVEVLPGTMAEQQWKGDMSDTEEESDDDDDDEEDEFTEYKGDIELEEAERDMDGEEAEGATGDAVGKAIEILEDGSVKTKDKKKSKKKKDRRSIRQEIEKLQEQLQLSDINRTPQLNENLRDFFARTADYWAQQIAERPDTIERQLSIKEMKREGFSLAEERYNELLPVLEKLNALELEQKQMEEEAQLKKKGSKDKKSRR